MRIGEALAGVVDGVAGEVEVTGVQYDSRRVGPGDLFVAMRGGSVDGNAFVRDAVARGAVAVVTDSAAGVELAGDLGVPVFRVGPDSENAGRRALAEIAANVLGHPERKLAVSAVTGTNGKTTTAWILEQLLRSVGRRCVLVGTIETHVGDEVRVSEHTTPEASDLLRLFADGVAAGCTEVVMEMSSHALEQERVWGVPVDVGIFTNLTQDHLDYHETMGAYARSKAKLFSGVGTGSPRVAVINETHQRYTSLMREAFKGEIAMMCTVDQGYGDSYMAHQVVFSRGFTSFVFWTRQGEVLLQSPLSGWINVENLLVAACAALARGLTLEQIATATRALKQVPGRFEVVDSGDLGFTVVVDYAHTADALLNLLEIARLQVAENDGKIITVFGCGGDRDKTKRSGMGRAASENGDFVVLTSDNPRTENPDEILNEVLAGVRQTRTPYVVEPDRRRAIEVAIQRAMPGDIVLIAGKGHEKVQILKGGTVPFDDVAVAEDVMRGLAR